MLTDDFPLPHPIHNIVCPGKPSERLATGVYLRPGFGGTDYVPGWEDWPNVKPGPYGVCDCYQQVLEQCLELKDPERTFVLFLTEVRRDEQPREGGWRWHKWGPYIGNHEPQHEYLYDEDPKIDKVFCYHIYEKPEPKSSKDDDHPLRWVTVRRMKGSHEHGTEKRVAAAAVVERPAFTAAELHTVEQPDFTAAELRTVERYLQMRLNQTDQSQEAQGNLLWVELNLLVDQLKQVQDSERATKSEKP